VTWHWAAVFSVGVVVVLLSRNGTCCHPASRGSQRQHRVWEGDGGGEAAGVSSKTKSNRLEVKKEINDNEKHT
jgi:hypothetical protein